MDPVTASSAVKAGLSLYEAGGLALVLLAIIVVGAFLMGRFLIGHIRTLGARIDHLEDRQVNQLNSTIEQNTAALHDLTAKTDEQTGCIRQQTEVLRARPCLIESGSHPRPTLPSR